MESGLCKLGELSPDEKNGRLEWRRDEFELVLVVL